MLTPELEKYYKELFEMFQSPGWKHYEEYVNKIYNEHVQKGWRLPTPEELLINKGMVANLEQLANFQEEHENAYETQLEESKETE